MGGDNQCKGAQLNQNAILLNSELSVLSETTMNTKYNSKQKL
jgi:hypothetical protein